MLGDVVAITVDSNKLSTPEEQVILNLCLTDQHDGQTDLSNKMHIKLRVEPF